MLIVSASPMASQTYLSDLEWAPDSSYVIITKADGEPVYITRDSLIQGIDTDNQTITVVGDSLYITDGNGVKLPLVTWEMQSYNSSTVEFSGTAITPNSKTYLTLEGDFDYTRLDSTDEISLTDDQFITFTVSENLDKYDLSLMIEDGNSVIRSIDRPARCENITGITTIDVTPTLPLGASLDVWLNGVQMISKTVPWHLQHYKIVNGKITFIQNLVADDIVRYCTK